jgi:hypothetical protein
MDEPTLMFCKCLLVRVNLSFLLDICCDPVSRLAVIVFGFIWDVIEHGTCDILDVH